MNDSIEYKIASIVKQEGGRTFYVGGYVRDKLRNIENKDIDIEVHGVDEKKLYTILSQLGTPLSYGKQFGIYSLKEYSIDIALPRKEKKIGPKHDDFEVTIDPYIDITEAIRRRDFTINGIYEDVLTHKIIDPYNGKKDLANGIIRHIDDDKFIEDPLRVFRACQFASRFDFTIAKETIDLCKQIDVKSLSKQRVEEELKKALMLSKKPSIFFKYLKQMDKFDYWFKDVKLDYLDEACKSNSINNKYEYLLTTLCINTNFDISRIIEDKKIIKYINSMINNIDVSLDDDYQINKTFYNLQDINDYICLRMLLNKEDKYLFEKYEKYKNIMNKPYVMGKDLIELGYEPSDIFNKTLEYANELRLKGIEKQEALNIISEYIKNISIN